MLASAGAGPHDHLAIVQGAPTRTRILTLFDWLYPSAYSTRIHRTKIDRIRYHQRATAAGRKNKKRGSYNSYLPGLLYMGTRGLIRRPLGPLRGPKVEVDVDAHHAPCNNCVNNIEINHYNPFNECGQAVDDQGRVLFDGACVGCWSIGRELSCSFNNRGSPMNEHMTHTDGNRPLSGAQRG